MKKTTITRIGLISLIIFLLAPIFYCQTKDITIVILSSIGMFLFTYIFFSLMDFVFKISEKYGED